MPKIDWNSKNTQVMCMLFAEQVGKGNRPNTHLNALGNTEVEKGFKEKTGIVVTKVQIKWDKLKEDFKAWKKLMLRQTGTGWDPIKKTIAMDDEWWKKARADIPGCGKFKKKGLENEDDLAKCFVDITTIGIDHWSPHVVNVEATKNVDETQDEATNFEPQDDDVIPEIQEEDIGISPLPASDKRLARPVERSGKKVKSGNALLIQEAMPGYSMVTQKKIVAATMVLHNFIREHASVDVDFANFDRDPTYMPTIPKRYNKYAVSQHASDGSTSESSFVTMDTFHNNMATSIALAWN
ncbi:uncharacterized protein [Miscanthus floridulus]|uniref:uncharacterized protein n=1 Tax=Miscanthus floridulus TaxID=154761 RepID=UPI0034584227